MMRILVDPQIFYYGRCGLVRYYSVVCKQLEALGCEIDLPLLVSNSDFIDGRIQFITRLPFMASANWFRRRSMRLSKKWYYHKLRKGGYDGILVTSPIFEDEFLSYVGDAPFLMVVHDTMQCIMGPSELMDASGPNADRLAYLARRAAKIVCISESTQRDLISLCSVEKEKTTVIHTGNLLKTKQPVKPARDIPKRFILFVGDRTGRKNFRAFVQAIAPLLSESEDLKLVCTGQFTIWERDLLDSLGIADKCLEVEVNDQELSYLYKHALCLTYPSLYEGFGLPVLEAMTQGCPVVTSDTRAIREVGGNGVVYVNPADRNSITEGVQRVIDQPELRSRLIEAGHKQAETFSLDRMMKQFLEVARELQKLKSRE